MGSREEKVWKGNLKENREGNGSRKIKKYLEWEKIHVRKRSVREEDNKSRSGRRVVVG